MDTPRALRISTLTSQTQVQRHARCLELRSTEEPYTLSMLSNATTTHHDSKVGLIQEDVADLEVAATLEVALQEETSDLIRLETALKTR